MAQAKTKKDAGAAFAAQVSRTLREGGFILLLGLALYVCVALLTYDVNDPGWSYSGSGGRVVNAGGVVGAWLADFVFWSFGYFAYLLPLLLGYGGWVTFRGRDAIGAPEYRGHRAMLALRLAGLLLTLFAGGGLAALHWGAPAGAALDNGGGVVGTLIADAMAGMFNFLGATLLLLVLFLVGVTAATRLSWLEVMDRIGAWLLRLGIWFAATKARFDVRRAARQVKAAREERVEVKRRKIEPKEPIRIEPVIRELPPSKRVDEERQLPLLEPPEGAMALPPLSALDDPKEQDAGYSKERLEHLSQQVVLKLLDFSVEVQVEAVQPGPVVTRFELLPAPGVKISKDRKSVV